LVLAWVHPHWSLASKYSAAKLSYFIDFLEAPNDLDAAIEARMERQRIIYSGQRRFAVLLEEQAIRVRVGSVDIMAGQLDRLLAIMSLPRVRLGIIPAARLVWSSPRSASGSTTIRWSGSRRPPPAWRSVNPEKSGCTRKCSTGPCGVAYATAPTIKASV